MFREMFCGYVKGARCPCFINGNVDAPDPGFVHPDVGDKITSGVHDRDVHRLTDGLSFLLRGGDDFSGVCECYHKNSFNERYQRKQQCATALASFELTPGPHTAVVPRFSVRAESNEITF